MIFYLLFGEEKHLSWHPVYFPLSVFIIVVWWSIFWSSAHMLFCFQTSLGSLVYPTRKSSLEMIYISCGEEGGFLNCLLAWKRVCIIRREKHENVRKKMQENVRIEGKGQKLAKIYLKRINFFMDKISGTATSFHFCVVF